MLSFLTQRAVDFDLCAVCDFRVTSPNVGLGSGEVTLIPLSLFFSFLDIPVLYTN